MEDSAACAGASITVMLALEGASALPEPAAAVRLVLEHARRALSAERAFLVEEGVLDGDVPRVLESASVRPGAQGSPSRTAARALLAGDVRGAELSLDPDSVRALELRVVRGAPLPGAKPRRALVLDSRRAAAPPCAEDAATLSGFAALLGLAARRLPPLPRRFQEGWVGASPAYLALLERVEAVAASRLPVLVTGESGSGKEGVARRIHACGPRARGPFVAVNCAAVPDALLEGELFGAVRGAYTGADRDRDGLFRAADRGTLFLDEVGDMPLPMQAKLLRVLQDGHVRPVGSAEEHRIDVRVLAATHRNLQRSCLEGSFRADLFYRLAVLEVRVPPLRERMADFPALVPFLLDKLATTSGIPACTASPCTLVALARYAWPGNVRELESVLARAAVRARGGILEPEHLEMSPSGGAVPPELRARPGESLERAMVRVALAAASGSMTTAASHIGWTRQKLYRRMVALGLYPASGSDDGTTSSASSTFQ